MKRTIITFTFISLLAVSCENTDQKKELKDETPKALQDNSYPANSYSISRENMLEKLYSEMAQESQELKDIEARISALKESENDSTQSFNNYNAKNRLYYDAADKMVKGIKDSVLRTRLKSLISKSLENYNSRIVTHDSLLKSIGLKKAKLNDLHSFLKIAKTLPLIEKFQRENIPSTRSLSGLEEQTNRALSQVDSLMKK